ncbi:hypothetical protein Asru_0086_18 [Acidisphaera rubrifaciens HS-AP3]|uniref:Uncharacterized protein n=1 Tax=Acidisphaera rubrifaciens HS-AP3 TaxID=1231350 RepID=A0A0D6P3W4_9PROT|nr:hypothetical protein Asru_0086_18 [Acidisphaera rubrifaciens HS-AP3]
MSRREHIAQMRRRRRVRRRRHLVMAGVSAVLAAPYFAHLRAMPASVAYATRPPVTTLGPEPVPSGSGRTVLSFMPQSGGIVTVEREIVGGDGVVIASLPRLRLCLSLCEAANPGFSAGGTPHGHRR